MRRKHLYILALSVLSLALAACEYEKMPLPVAETSSGGFGANDTSYVELNPVWDSSFLGVSLQNPTDIVTGPDGYIFLLDKGNNRVLAMNQSGQILSHNNLNSITGIESPTGIDIDSKLNLFVVNGGNQVWCWNQYFNTVGIDSLAWKIVLRNTTTGDTVHYNFLDPVELEQPDDYIYDKMLFEPFDPQEQPVRELNLFYEDNTPGTQINDVASDGEFVYLTDSGNQRIIKVAHTPRYLVKTEQGFIIQYNWGIFNSNCVGYGTGAGTVDNPQSIIADDDNIYFTQYGGNFKVQKLDNVNYSSQYTLYQDPIMDLNRFVEPASMALDDAGNVYVMDTGAGKVEKFTRDGNAKSLGSSGIALAEFDNARGIMVSENVIYVVETGQDRIRRFQYSISDEDVPDDKEP